MIRTVCIVLLVLFPGWLTAETIAVRSGEHPGFSRLVLQFAAPVEWEFGRVENGYEFRSTAYDAIFDLNNVFSFIPKTRLSDVTQTGPGRLVLGLACACTPDAFGLGDGRIVLDIRDVGRATNRDFDKKLTPLGLGAKWQGTNAQLVDQVAPNRPAIVATNDDFESEVALRATSYAIGPNLLPGSNETRERDPGESIPALTGVTPGEMRPVLPGKPETGIGPTPQMHPNDQPATANAESVVIDEVATVKNAPQDQPQRAKPQPVARLSDLLVPVERNPQSEQVVAAKRQLLEQLSKAIAQGLIRVDVSAADLPGPSNPTDDTPDQLPPDGSLETALAQLTGPQIRVETAVDRNQTTAADFVTEKVNCLPPERFDFLSWGSENVSQDLYGNLRANSVLEFDKPDPVAIEKLVQRYLFLGFGAEARVLVQTFALDTPHAQLFAQLSDVLDNGSTDLAGPLWGQIGCTNGGAVWSMLAQKHLPQTAELNTKAIVSDFMNLPPHLRVRTGPWLAEQFSEIGDLASATTVRGATDRASDINGTRFALMDARLNAKDGNDDEALLELGNIARGGGPLAATALVELFDAMIDKDQAIDKDFAVLADALAIENRGTELGDQLTRAAIQGFAYNGQIAAAFEKITDATDAGDISADEADVLRIETHLRNAQLSSDPVFLQLYYQNEQVFSASNDLTSPFVHTVADRLIELGLPETAESLFRSAAYGDLASDLMLPAKTQYQLENYAKVLELLRNANDDASLLLKARANEMLKNYSQAADLFAKLALPSERESAFWRDGDWQSVALIGSDNRAKLAQILQDSTKQQVAIVSRPNDSGDPRISASDPEQGDPAPVLKTEPPLTAGKKLISQSSAVRDLIASLMPE